jgi:hypothetical protein
MEKETARAWFFRGLEASGDGSHSTFAKAMKIFNEEWDAEQQFIKAATELLENED